MEPWSAVVALNSEWAQLSQAEPPPWGELEPELAAASLPDLLELIRERPDPVLAALLRLGRAGEQLAWRVVLQAMLGMLVRLCSAQPQRSAEAVSELWLLIAEYPLERRPAAIAANLRWELHRRLTDRPPFTEVAGPIEAMRESATTEPDAATTLRQARQLGLIDPATHRTLWEVYVVGRTSAQAASRLGTTATAVRWRCSRALRRLAGHAEVLAA